MTIYELLKNSSPSMARHFMDSENGIKELKNRVTALEGGSGGSDAVTAYEPLEKIFNGNREFTVRDRVVGNETKKEYLYIEKIDTETGKKHKFNSTFTPHGSIFTNMGVDGFYHVDVPLMDDYTILKNADVTAMSIGRGFDKDGNLKEITVTITESIYLGLGNETIDSLKVYF